MAEKNEQEGGRGQAEAPKKKSPVMLIGILGVGLILMAGGGFFAMKLFISPSGAEPEQKPQKVLKASNIGPIFPLETFIVNLADQDTPRYLKVTIQLEMDGEKLKEELDKRIPQIRDTIIELLTIHTYRDVASYKGKAMLRAEIMNKVNNMLVSGTVKRVYFTEFVIQ